MVLIVTEFKFKFSISLFFSSVICLCLLSLQAGASLHIYIRGPQPPGLSPPLDPGLFETRPHKWMVGARACTCTAQCVQTAGWHAPVQLDLCKGQASSPLPPARLPSRKCSGRLIYLIPASQGSYRTPIVIVS